MLLGAGARAVFLPADWLALRRHDEVRRAWWQLRRAAGARPPHRPSFEAIRSAQAAGLQAGALTFGDTPVSLAIALLRGAGVTTGDVLLDPLAGRGHVLLAARSLGAQARGLEIDGAHVGVAAEILAAAGAVLETGDARFADFSAATCVYLAWTCLAVDARARIGERLAALTPGTRVIALTWEPSSSCFAVVARSRRRFPWGLADVIYARRR